MVRRRPSSAGAWSSSPSARKGLGWLGYLPRTPFGARRQDRHLGLRQPRRPGRPGRRLRRLPAARLPRRTPAGARTGGSPPIGVSATAVPAPQASPGRLARRRSWCRRRGRCARRCRRGAGAAAPGSTRRSAAPSLYDRPVAPGTAVEQRVAGEDAAEVGGEEADRARASGPGCAARSASSRRPGLASPSARSTSQRWSGWVSSHSGRSSGCSRIGAPSRPRAAPARPARGRRGRGCTRSRVTRRSPTTARMSSTECGRVDHHALVVVADHPDVVVDVEGLRRRG